MRRGGWWAMAVMVALGACGGEESGSPAPAESERDPFAHARSVLERTPIFDGHNDLPWEIRASEEAPMDVAAYDLNGPVPGHTNLERLEAGGVGGQFWSVYIPGEYADSGFARLQLEQIDLARRMIDRYPELVLVGTADGVEAAMADGRVASMLGVEGGHAIENSLGALRTYYDLGARYMTLTHNVTLDWADAAQDTARNDGLSRFGEEVVREMNRLGMLVDLSHVSPATMSDVLNVSEAPVIFSHSSARALTDVPRNVPDSILTRMAVNGGVVMVTFVQPFVNQDAADYDDALAATVQEMLDAGTPDDDDPGRGPAHAAREPPSTGEHRRHRGSHRTRPRRRRDRPRGDRLGLRRDERSAGDARRLELPGAVRAPDRARLVGRRSGQTGERQHPAGPARGRGCGGAPAGRTGAVDGRDHRLRGGFVVGSDQPGRCGLKGRVRTSLPSTTTAVDSGISSQYSTMSFMGSETTTMASAE